MGFLKRQLWLVITIGVMVVLSLPFLYMWFSSQGKKSTREKVYKASKEKIVGSKPYYNSRMAEYLERAAEYRTEQRKKILESQRGRQNWPLLVSKILPTWPGESRVFEFKNRYRQKIQEFMKTLNAVDVDDLGGVEITATMFAKEDRFFTAQWINELRLGSHDVVMEGLRRSQDDIYIQEDIVNAIRRTNDLYFESMKLPENKRTVRNAVIKELVQIGIGGAFDTLPSDINPESREYIGGRRDRVVEDKDYSGPGGAAYGSQQTEAGEVPGKRADTMTGHASNNNGNKYKVLPFRLVVIVDAGNYQELLRQLGGTRSFFIVEQVRFKIIPEIASGYKSFDLAIVTDASSRLRYYGERPIGQLVLVGESLIFKGTGRPTLKPEEKDLAALPPSRI
ncbi:MAG: hypothetical protein GWP05_02295 [Anaerolineaceae bacterium]|nr:hypothetical protein [Anaerolineaceae bacterium]